MAIRKYAASIDVVEAAKIRIQNIFNNNVPVFMSFSGGKDSLCLANLTVELIQQGKINPKLLTVQFIDEEAIFPCIEKTVKEWRKKFLMLGAKFEWYCMQYKHYNCFNQLENDESFICWDETKKSCWIRQPPPFAVRCHPLLRERKDTYQDFLDKCCKYGITIVGVRTAESLQRLQNIARRKNDKNSETRKKLYPIYDWKDTDVWLYLKEHNVEIPDIYLFMWQAGAGKRQMRVSQFFSIDTARSLVKMNEYYPNLLDSIIKREPNAYLAALYWDSEMFGRSGTTRKKLEEGQKKKDYRAELAKMFADFDAIFDTPHKKQVAKSYRNFFIAVSNIIDDNDLKKLYEGLCGGDPKLRTLRALYQSVYTKYNVAARKAVTEGVNNNG